MNGQSYEYVFLTTILHRLTVRVVIRLRDHLDTALFHSHSPPPQLALKSRDLTRNICGGFLASEKHVEDVQLLNIAGQLCDACNSPRVSQFGGEGRGLIKICRPLCAVQSVLLVLNLQRAV